MRLAVLLAVLVLPLAACGGSTGGASSAPETSLTVTMWPAGQSGPSKTATVNCPGDEACDKLASLPLSAFAPTPRNIMCTDIYGGPEQATVKGTLRGEAVDATFKRSDGCETGRWDHVSFLLGRAS